MSYLEGVSISLFSIAVITQFVTLSRRYAHAIKVLEAERRECESWRKKYFELKGSK